MIIDFKYHIASLVAVFMALGIGILIGSTMLGNDAVIEQQKQLTDRLTLQLEELRQKNEAVEAKASILEMDVNVQREFEKQVIPVLVKDTLKDKRIAIVETNNYGYPDALIEVLQTAGAAVISTTTIIDGFELERREQEIKDYFGWQELNTDELSKHLAGEIARGIVSAGNDNLINFLAEADFIDKTGDYGIPVDAVILMGGSQDENMIRVNSLDLPLMDYFLSKKIPVYGVEESGAVHSYIKDYQKKRISTVDNIDTVPGQVSLILAIAGQPGHYGTKSTAQRLMPAMVQ